MVVYVLYESMQDSKIRYAIPCGFNWAAFFFGFLWALSNRLIIVALGLFVANIAIQSLFDFLNMKAGWNFAVAMWSILFFGYSLLIGLYGNLWRSHFLYDSGYRAVGFIEASSAKEAMNNFDRGRI